MNSGLIEFNCAQRTGLYAGWEIEFRPPWPLLIENILIKVKTNAQQCLSSPELMPGFAIG
ncbi:hypothetical protein [Flavihumibacter fluvii]|uniref:hypothetical protein n=1 Tax=Flavihumibacter fluvii TaxID=2838157 RepID=UPI001BDE9498|nr:hypothetical protein [Flavihumibacter fluvii]ULQ53352.1 hypothetical protein KJS93_03350 [Flavihumibacter fluvii]